MELGEVLARYPNEVIAVDRGKRRGAARRAIWAHYALLQDPAGEPDIDPGDRAAVARVVREEGAEVARCPNRQRAEDVRGRLSRPQSVAGPDLVSPPGTVELAAVKLGGGRERLTYLRALCRRMF
jgi:hypothetical protein